MSWNDRTARAVAAEVGIDDVRAELLPDGKVDAVRSLQERDLTVAMVGDGINDAPSLKQADVGIAIGPGTDIAIEAADLTLVHGSLAAVERAVLLSRATFRKIRQNLFWAFFYNTIAIPVAILGLLHPILAEAAMALSQINSDSALEVLTRALVDTNYRVRLWASKGLVRAKKNSVPILVAHLSPDSPLSDMGYQDESNREHSIREEILNCLTKIGKPAVPFLKATLDSEDAGLVGQVIGVLGAIGKDSSEAIGKIISAAQEGVASSIRQKAVTAIGEIGDVNPTVTPTLFKLKNDPDDNVAKAAQAALKKLQEKSESE